MTLHTQKNTITAHLFRISAGLLGIAVLGFIGNKIYPMIHGPMLDMQGITDGAVVSNAVIDLHGTASYTQQLVINGNTLPMDPRGSFQEKIVLNPGYNVMTFHATDRFGKTTSKTYRLVLTETSPAPVASLHQ